MEVITSKRENACTHIYSLYTSLYCSYYLRGHNIQENGNNHIFTSLPVYGWNVMYDFNFLMKYAGTSNLKGE